MKPLETTVEEVLREAIQSEIETRCYYQKMAERAGSPEVRKRMLQLADGELLHRAKMERKYREVMKKAPTEPQPVTLELPPEIRDLDMARALKLALERERDSESYYRFMAERAPVDSELANLFFELADIEWKHKTDLQSEYDASLNDPEQFFRDF
ncbi:MAG TPA: ferritin family protein [Thermoanaerobaculia bacterium]|nr:ferritin family protein [Thermoanaerobaculia bacterium]